MKFGELAKYLQKLEGISSRNAMTVILAELFKKASPEDARLIAYLSQGRLGPAYASPDTGVADKMMVKALGGEASNLFKKLGDLGLVAQELGQGKGSLTVKEVNEKLLAIANASGQGSQETKQKLIGELLKDLDPVAAKYAVKIILGKMRIGFSDMTVLDSLSWMIAGDKSKRPQIEAMYNVRADLGEIARSVREHNQPAKIEPELGTPILMARAERATSAVEIWKRNGKCAVEYKLDGLRIQAHIKKGEVTLFSRGLENVTVMYPDITQGLQKQINKDCIVEGEMIAVGKNGRFLPFQETVQRKRKYQIAEMAGKIPLKIYLFDVLVDNSKDVMHQANQDRRELLEKIVKSGETVKLMGRIIAKNVTEIESFFHQALADGTEGIIAKKLYGPYQAGARDFNWIKYKKSYAKSALADTIDAVVMGYDVGQGKRQQFGIGDFLIGVYDHEKDKYFTVAKIGTGLTDEEWRRMKLTVDSCRLTVKPENYRVMKMMDVDVWVKPRVVVEVMADEITKSPMHSSGYALRFPRLISWREKKPQDATTVTEIENMFKLQKRGGDN